MMGGYFYYVWYQTNAKDQMVEQFDISMLQTVQTKIFTFGSTIATTLLNVEVAARVSDGTAYPMFRFYILNVQY